MNFPKKMTLMMLSLGTLYSQPSISKTLIFDDFLKYQDTSSVHFDFSKPIQGISVYESQFMVDSPFKACKSGTSSPDNPSDDELYQYVRACKGIDFGGDVFKERKHQNQFQADYVNEYKQYVNNFFRDFYEIEKVEIRNIFHKFDIKNYDLNSGIYRVSLANGADGMEWYINSDPGFEFPFHQIGVFAKRRASSEFSFYLPIEAAEEIYEDDGALVFNLLIEINPKCISARHSFPRGYWDFTFNSECEQYSDVKSTNASVEAVKKNELYSKYAFEIGNMWGKIPNMMEKGDGVDYLLKLLGDRKIIFSTDKVKAEN